MSIPPWYLEAEGFLEQDRERKAPPAPPADEPTFLELFLAAVGIAAVVVAIAFAAWVGWWR